MADTSENAAGFAAAIPKREIKDSVFKKLFSIKKYLLQLVRVLHPSEEGVTEDDLTDVSIRPVLVNGIYNDLGFTVGSKRITLVESQSTWTENIVPRAFFYMADSYLRYLADDKARLYQSPKVKLPEPECYVVYTGKRGNKPDRLTLRESFFDGKEVDIDVVVHFIYLEDDKPDGETLNIIEQYIKFCRVSSDGIRNGKPIKDIIDDCIKQGILAEFLTEHREEVITVMDFLFNQEEIDRSRYMIVRKDSLAEGMEKGRDEGLLSAIKSLIQTSEFSAREAMRRIGIAPADYGKYERMLIT